MEKEIRTFRAESQIALILDSIPDGKRGEFINNSIARCAYSENINKWKAEYEALQKYRRTLRIINAVSEFKKSTLYVQNALMRIAALKTFRELLNKSMEAEEDAEIKKLFALALVQIEKETSGGMQNAKRSNRNERASQTD